MTRYKIKKLAEQYKTYCKPKIMNWKRLAFVDAYFSFDYKDKKRGNALLEYTKTLENFESARTFVIDGMFHVCVSFKKR